MITLKGITKIFEESGFLWWYKGTDHIEVAGKTMEGLSIIFWLELDDLYFDFEDYVKSFLPEEEYNKVSAGENKYISQWYSKQDIIKDLELFHSKLKTILEKVERGI